LLANAGYLLDRILNISKNLEIQHCSKINDWSIDF